MSDKAKKLTPEQEAKVKEIDRQIAYVGKLMRVEEAKDDFLKFVELTMPDHTKPDDLMATRYEAAIHHKAIAQALQEVEKGNILRLIITMPPRHGKSELASRRFPAWFMGKDKTRQVIFATYSSEFSEEFGRTAREILLSEEYQSVFPGVLPKTDTRSSKRMEIVEGGMMAFTSVGGSVTGRGADCLIIDDPFKDRADAESLTIREKRWDWFTSTAYTRLMPGGRIIIIMCMTGDTPVLMSDGKEKLLRDIRPGDYVATYDNKRLTTAKVKNWSNNGLDSVFRIKMTSGKVVKANARHPFLVNDEGEPKWVRVKNLRRGQEIFRVNGESGKTKNVSGMVATSLQNVADIAARITTKNDGLMAYAHHLRTKILNHGLVQNLNTVTESLSTITSVFYKNRKVCAQYVSASLETPVIQNTGTTCCASITAIPQGRFEGFFAMAATWLSAASERLKFWKQQQTTCDFTLDVIESIDFCGVEDVFDIQVEGTENFIANGLVSHNTRWHEDDMVGRLLSTDYMKQSEIDKWHRLDLPAIANENSENERALWPDRYPLRTLHEIRNVAGPRDWNALYQQRPTPPEGAFFNRSSIQNNLYSINELPSNLTIYSGFDLAVGTKKVNDHTCCLSVGMDADDNLWLLPELFWDKQPADQSVAFIAAHIQYYDPMTVYCEKGQLDKAVGPFLTKYMHEHKIYKHFEKLPSVANKGARATAIRGLISQNKVKFPKDAIWWARAFEQLLKFTGSGDDKEDDFVDCLALIGQGLHQQLFSSAPMEAPKQLSAIGTFGWVKAQSVRERQQANSGGPKGW